MPGVRGAGSLRQGKRGRPAQQAAGATGTYVQVALERAGLSEQELARRLGVSHSTISRLVHGRIAHSTRITLDALMDALELADDDRGVFREMFSGLATDVRAANQPLSTVLRSTGADRESGGRRRGRPPRVNSAIGSHIQVALDGVGATQAALADVLGVSPSTVSRIVSGQTARSHRIEADAVAAALKMDDMKRREFLRMAGEMGALALAVGLGAPNFVKLHRLDLDALDAQISLLEHALDSDYAQNALERAHELCTRAFQAPLAATDRAAADVRIHAAMALGRVQESGLRWYARTQPAMDTYNHLQDTVLCWFAPADMPSAYARLYERRAPLYRELGQYGQSIEQFTFAVDACTPHLDDPALRVTLYRNRAHVWAVQGQERQWRADLDHALALASTTPAVMRHELEGMILYSEAEGYKRLAGAILSLDMRARRRYAEKALDSFDAARYVGKSQWLAHTVLAEVSEAQCLIWLDAADAIVRLGRLRASAEQIYPSLLAKIDQAAAEAWRVQMRPVHRNGR